MEYPHRITSNGVYIPNFLLDSSSLEYDGDIKMYSPILIEYGRIVEELENEDRRGSNLVSLIDELKKEKHDKVSYKKLELLAGLTLGERFMSLEEYCSMEDLSKRDGDEIISVPVRIVNMYIDSINNKWNYIQNSKFFGISVGSYKYMRPSGFEKISSDNVEEGLYLRVNPITRIVQINDCTTLLTPCEYETFIDSITDNTKTSNKKELLSKVRKKLKKIGFSLKGKGYNKGQKLMSCI
mgnify:CR=1 FL=1